MSLVGGVDCEIAECLFPLNQSNAINVIDCYGCDIHDNEGIYNGFDIDCCLWALSHAGLCV